MLTDPFALDRLVRDRIHSRLAEADNDRLVDSLPAAAPSHRASNARHATANLLRSMAASIDPCLRAEPGLLIATR